MGEECERKDSDEIALTTFFYNLKMGSTYVIQVLPQIIIPYCINDKNKALYKHNKVIKGTKFLNIKNIPHFLASFFGKPPLPERVAVTAVTVFCC